MAPSARTKLQADVHAIQKATDLRQTQNAITALAQLQSDVAQFEANGSLSTTAGAQVLHAAASVQTNLQLIATTTTTSTTTTSTTTTTTTSTTTTTLPQNNPFPPFGNPGGGKHNGPNGGH
jgi:hypothetical protein